MPKWPIKKGRESEHHFWGFPQVIRFWSESVPNNNHKKIESVRWKHKSSIKALISLVHKNPLVHRKCDLCTHQMYICYGEV
jgi:hypothetical protein